MHSTTLVAVAVALAASPAFAAPAAPIYARADNDVTPANPQLQRGALTSAQLNQGFNIASAVLTAGNAAIDAFDWLKQQLGHKRQEINYSGDESGALTNGDVNHYITTIGGGIGVFDQIVDIASKIKEKFFTRDDVDGAALGEALANLLVHPHQRREPFVIVDGDSTPDFTFPEVIGANGKPLHFHALARSLNELD